MARLVTAIGRLGSTWEFQALKEMLDAQPQLETDYQRLLLSLPNRDIRQLFLQAALNVVPSWAGSHPSLTEDGTRVLWLWAKIGGRRSREEFLRCLIEVAFLAPEALIEAPGTLYRPARPGKSPREAKSPKSPLSIMVPLRFSTPMQHFPHEGMSLLGVSLLLMFRIRTMTDDPSQVPTSGGCKELTRGLHLAVQ